MVGRIGVKIMNVYKIVMSDSLEHHGILGMHWGVRRYQNKDGSYTSAGRARYGIEDASKYKNDHKGAKKWYKTNENKLINEHNRFDDEFDKTDSGKKLRNEYEKEIKKMYDDPDFDDNASKQAKFNKAEEEYLRAQAEYSAKKLIEKYGDDAISIYASRGKINTGKNAIKTLSDEWWIHAI